MVRQIQLGKRDARSKMGQDGAIEFFKAQAAVSQWFIGTPTPLSREGGTYK